MRLSSPALVLVAFALAACSSGSSKTPELRTLGDDTDSGSVSSSGDSGAAAADGCPSAPYILPLSDSVGVVGTIVSDGSTLYLGTDAGIFSLPVGGGSLTPLYGQLETLTSTSGVADFWFSGSNVLVINDNTYKSAPKAGGNPGGTAIQTLPNADGTAFSDGTNVYFITNPFGKDADGGVTTIYSLYSMPLAGGTPQLLHTFDGPPDNLMLYSGVFYWIDAGLAFFSSGPIYTLPTSGGTAVNTGIIAASGQLAADDTNLYFTSQGQYLAGPAMRVPRNDLTQAPVQVSDLGGQWLVVQGDALYGAIPNGGNYQAWKALIAGDGSTHTLMACAPPGTTAQGLGVDASNMYLSVTHSTGETSGILSVPR